MKRDQIQALLFLFGLGVIVAGLLIQRTPGNAAAKAARDQAALHEIQGEDPWTQQQAMMVQGQSGMVQDPQGMAMMQGQPGMVQNPQWMEMGQNQMAPFAYGPQYYNPNVAMQPVAMAQQAKTPIMEGQAAPVLIKQMGMEVIEISGGKVKVTGVMGGSWADKGGLKPGDIILRFSAKPINSLKEFQAMTLKAAPEMDYPVKYLRNGDSKKTLVTIGEGEMEGFLPIKRVPVAAQGATPVAFGNAMGFSYSQAQPGACTFHCPHCGKTITTPPAMAGTVVTCPVCTCVMQRI